jgi:hypothetical protein
VSEKSHGKRVKVPVDAKPKAPIWLPDAELASGVQDCGRKQAGRMHTVVIRDAKMEIPGKPKTTCLQNRPLRLGKTGLPP